MEGNKPSVHYFGEVLAKINDVSDAGHRYTLLHSSIRSILQWTSFAAIEACAASFVDLEESLLPEMAHQLLLPVDGALAPVIEQCLVYLSHSGYDYPLESWLSPNDATGRSAAATANDWVAMRNAHLGHGVVGDEQVLEGLPQLAIWTRSLLSACAPMLPEHSGEYATLTLEDRFGNVRQFNVSALRLTNGAPTVVRSIRLRADRWAVASQQLDPSDAKATVYELPKDSLYARLLNEDVERYRQRRLPGMTSHSQVLLPNRQTDSFTGRREELAKVLDWLGDSESRVCNIYGEGGIGKTTLALEALHRLVEGRLEANTPKIEIICFYSSKLTRYGPEGIERIGGITPSVADAAREVARSYHERLDKTWFGKEPIPLIERTAQLLRELGIDRDQVLVVLDNTETLISVSSDRDALAEAVDLMARKVGRVLITSRNRERVEAKPISLGPLSDTESEQLLERLAEEEGATALLQTGVSGRRRFGRRFRGKPLLIEVFVRMVARKRLSLSDAEQVVLKHAEAELGTFLYEDAWARFDNTQQRIMLALSRIDAVIDSNAVGTVCAAFGCSHLSMFDSLEGNRFAQIQDYGAQYDIVFDSMALAFLGSKFAGLSPSDQDGIERTLRDAQTEIRRHRLTADLEIEDRFASAFQSDAAKLAWLAVRRNDFDEARMWFDEAIFLEPHNVALLHRYAFVLTRYLGQYREATRVALMATDEDPGNAEAWFVLACASARLADTDLVDRACFEAQRAGFKQKHRCALQQARARVLRLRRSPDPSHEEIKEAKQFLSASRVLKSRNWLDEKHMSEVDRVSGLLDSIKAPR